MNFPPHVLCKGDVTGNVSPSTAQVRMRREAARLVSEMSRNVADDGPKHVPVARRCRHLCRHERPESSSQNNARQINKTVEDLSHYSDERCADQEADKSAQRVVHAGVGHVRVQLDTGGVDEYGLDEEVA